MIKFDNLEGQLIKGKYRVKNKIGSGGAGKVYLAYDEVNNRNVAIKAANPHTTMSNFKERIDIEAKILSKCNHENIIKYYENFEIDGIKMIIIEYIEGISLEDKLHNEKTISVEEALKFSTQLLSALEELHSHKSYHRDIKPSNIHITTDGDIKLLDFGIVQESTDQEITRQGAVIGTISYMAPEILMDPSRKSDERTDIYSLGIMLYKLLTGVAPFKLTNDLNVKLIDKNSALAFKIVKDIAIEPHEVEPSISAEVSHFVMKLIEKTPEDRYQKVSEALADIKKIQNGATLKDLQGYYEEETKAFTTRKQIIVLSSVAGFILILIIVSIIIVLVK